MLIDGWKCSFTSLLKATLWSDLRSFVTLKLCPFICARNNRKFRILWSFIQRLFVCVKSADENARLWKAYCPPLFTVNHSRKQFASNFYHKSLTRKIARSDYHILNSKETKGKLTKQKTHFSHFWIWIYEALLTFKNLCPPDGLAKEIYYSIDCVVFLIINKSIVLQFTSDKWKRN